MAEIRSWNPEVFFHGFFFLSIIDQNRMPADGAAAIQKNGAVKIQFSWILFCNDFLRQPHPGLYGEIVRGTVWGVLR
jgi:hypothetical protein